MVLDLTTQLTLSTLSLFAGIMSAIAGSSGIVVLPALLLAGMPPVLALGTNKLYTSSSLFAASVHFIRQGLFKPRFWIAAALATLLGAVAGALITRLIHPQVLNKILPIIIALVALYLLLPSRRLNTREEKIDLPAQSKTIQKSILGMLLGLYSGFLGAATGSFWTSASMALFDMDILEASGISCFMCFISNSAALGVFMLLNQVDYRLGLLLASTGFVGAWFGSKLAVRYGNKIIRPMMIIVTTIMAIKLGIKAWI